MTIDSQFPLTLTQSDICVDQLRRGASPLYNVGGCILLGPVDSDRLAEAHARLVRESEVFGLRVAISNRGIFQYISSARTTALPTRDFSGEARPAEAFETWSRALFETPIDIHDTELFRVYLARVADDDYRYVGVTHHLMMDGWGFSNWAILLCRLYNDRSAGVVAAIPWREIALDDQAYAGGERYLGDKEFWAEYLREHIPPPLHPRYRNGFTDPAGIPSQRKIIGLSRTEFCELQSLTRGLGAGVSHHFLAMAALVLAGRSGPDRWMFGLPFHSRKDRCRKQMLGVFTSISPLCVDLRNGRQSFSELVQEIARSQKAVFRHQRYPLGHMVRDLAPPGARGLYDVAFNYLRLPDGFSVDGRTAGLVYLSHNHEATPLMITLCEHGEAGPVELQLDCNLAYFSEADMSLLVDRLSAATEPARTGYLSAIADLKLPDVGELAAPGPAPAAARPPRHVIAPPIVARAKDSEYHPLSFAQQRLWMVDQIGGGSSQYNLPGAFRIHGCFSPEIAERALKRIIERHEPLRTVFVSGANGPLQKVVADFDFHLVRRDVSDLPAEARERAVSDAVAQDASAPFDLGRDLMLRAAWIRLSETDAVICFNLHHIASDGWSSGILIREFFALYEAFSGNRPDPSPLPPIRYTDYVHWQREWLRGDVLEDQLSYWERQLAGLPDIHGVSVDHPRPPMQTFSGRLHSRELGPSTLRGLKQVAANAQATLFMALHSAFTLLLSRYGNSEDVAIGVPVANRPPETRDLVGHFVNLLVLRVDCRGGITFREYLERVRTVHVEAQARQDVPFELLVERMKAHRRPGYSPLFQILFSLDSSEAMPPSLPGLTIVPLGSGRTVAQYDLALTAREHARGLGLNFVCNSDLFEPATMERMSAHLGNLLRGIAADPGCRIEDLPLLSEGELRHLVFGLNDTVVEYPRDRCLQEWFEDQVKRDEGAVAVVCEERSLGYGELNRQANRLAHYLREQGVGGGTLVGLCMERSPEMVIGILGILKSGGAYVPLEPGYPQERLEFMISDSRPKLVVTQAGLESRLGEVPLLRLDADRAMLEDFSPANVSRAEAGLSAKDLAYVIYTSGSTGRPKGVMNEHAGVVNRLLWGRDTYGICGDDRILQKTPFSFDVSVWEFLLPLISGARLVMARPGGHTDPQYLAEIIGRERITIAHFVPSMLQVFLEHHPNVADWRLRDVFCSGEALPYGLQKRFESMLPGVRLHNLYGPTEAAIEVTSWECHPSLHPGIVPMGRPIANVFIYILNIYMKPVPPGIAGEIYIGGAAVARGYWNRPELTQERFLKDPFSLNSEARIYKTGDLGRWLPDGAIEYLGRNDFQVKIRGCRVEPGEIQRQLEQLPEVRSAVVMVRERASSDKYIAAYVERSRSANGNHTPEAQRLWAAELERMLRDRLPDYMVPSVTALDRIPLTANGKTDTQALRAMAGDAGPRHEYEAPSTETEARLLDKWAGLLGIDRNRLGVNAGLFDTGGHSLLVVRLANDIRAELGIELPVRAFFDAANFRDLAAKIDAECTMQRIQARMSTSVISAEGYL